MESLIFETTGPADGYLLNDDYDSASRKFKIDDPSDGSLFISVKLGFKADENSSNVIVGGACK